MVLVKFLQVFVGRRFVASIRPILSRSNNGIKQKFYRNFNSNSNKTDGKVKTKSKTGLFNASNSWKIGLGMLSISGMSAWTYMLLYWGAPVFDENGIEIVDQYTLFPKWKGRLYRCLSVATQYQKMIKEPNSKQLLPNVLQPPYYQPTYTLVLEMTGILVKPEWSITTGWRFRRRPGIDYFLKTLSHPMYEIVLFTHEDGNNVYSIVNGIDTNGMIMYRLFRDSTNYMNGSHVKDLSCLNRDLDKTIIIDCDPNAVQLQPNNAFCIPPWDGREDDETLIHLADFLKTLASNRVGDVKTVLSHYSEYDDPLKAFMEKQILLKKKRKESTKKIQNRLKNDNIYKYK